MTPLALDRRGLLAGVAAAGLLGLGIYFGSASLRHFDPLLLTYALAVLLSAFAVAYRYATWLQRPPTRLFWRRGRELLFRGSLLRNLAFVARASAANLLAHRFIRRRGFLRWFIHFTIAWGCLLAGAVTFPLVFGWLRFETRLDDPEVYRVVFLGLTAAEFRSDSIVRFVLFNLLNFSALMVSVGAILALGRRLRNEGAVARQQFGNDILPLLLLLAISLTGLLLTFSAHFLAGAGYSALSLLHALVVCLALLYIPFGKFFHAFQRPAQIGALLYRRENENGPQARCRRCARPFAGAMHVEDLKEVMKECGFLWDGTLDTCPACRRRRLGTGRAAGAPS